MHVKLQLNTWDKMIVLLFHTIDFHYIGRMNRICMCKNVIQSLWYSIDHCNIGYNPSPTSVSLYLCHKCIQTQCLMPLQYRRAAVTSNRQTGSESTLRLIVIILAKITWLNRILYWPYHFENILSAWISNEVD